MSSNDTPRRDKRTSGDVGLAGLEYYGLKDYKNLVSRRKWMIVTAALTIALLVSTAAYFYPNLYEAGAVIIVIPGQVPQSFVMSTATIDANQRLAMLQQEILSTTRLGQVIDELGLYRELKNSKTQEEIVAEMNKSIKIEPISNGGSRVKELQAFKVSFTSKSPKLAARVSNRLASLFIEENLKLRSQEVLGTTEFFEAELVKAKQELDAKADKVAQLRSKYATLLPEAQNLNLQKLTLAQLELRSEIDAVGRAAQQKLYLENLLVEDPAVVNLDSNAHSADTATLQMQLERLQTEMDQLRSEYGPSYPDVQSKAAEIQKVEQQIQELEKASPAAKSTRATALKRHNPVVEGQIAQLSEEIKKREAAQNEIKSQMAYYQRSLEQAPQVAQELAAAANDYNDAEGRYKHLEDRKFGADMSSAVETRQKGEQFQILEPAQPPEHPFQPNRPLLDIVGLGAGLIVGLLLAVGLEILDGTVKTKRELNDRLSSPVFAEIPWFMTDSRKKRQRIWAALAVSGNLILALGYIRFLAAALR